MIFSVLSKIKWLDVVVVTVFLTFTLETPTMLLRNPSVTCLFLSHAIECICHKQFTLN